MATRRELSSNENQTKIFVYFAFYPQDAPDKRDTSSRRSYREYSSTTSCSLTIGCISSRVGIRATLPLRPSRSTVSQSGTGTICVRSRLRSTSCRDLGLFLIVISSPAFTLYEATLTRRPFTSTCPCDTSWRAALRVLANPSR